MLIFVKKMDFDGTSCLHHAASSDQPETCEFLVKIGCNVNDKDRTGRTPLMDAAEIGSKRVIQVLIDNGADVNLEDKERYTALSYCIDFINKKEPRFYDVAVILIKKGANPNVCGKFVDRTILHCAVAFGELEFVKELIETHHANYRLLDSDDKTPLQCAEDYAAQNPAAFQSIIAYLQEKESQQQGGSCCNLM